MNDEDSELLVAWRAGSTRSGDRLLRRYHDDVRGYVSRRVSSGVDDIVQATFLAVVRDKGGYRGTGSFRGYLLGVARNQVFRSFRSQRRDRLVLGANAEASADDPTERVVLALSSPRIEPALSSIERELRVVVELFYWQDLTTLQVAAPQLHWET